MAALKTLIVVPAYNEGKHIASVLRAIPKGVGEILVVDNASADNTAAIAKKLKVNLIRHSVNMGKAGSLKDGFDYGITHNFDVVITMDADGEHPAEKIHDFLRGIKNKDMVIGQRKHYRSFFRKLLNRWNNLWIQLLLPDVEDTQCGFRAIRTELLRKMNLTSKGFEIEMEMLLEAYKNKARIGTVEIAAKSIRKTTLKASDYLRINNFFDRWILKNKEHLNMGNPKRLLLLTFASLGLVVFGSLGKLTGAR